MFVPEKGWLSGYIHVLLGELNIHISLTGYYWNIRDVKRWEVSWAKWDRATHTFLGFISHFQCKKKVPVCHSPIYKV